MKRAAIAFAALIAVTAVAQENLCPDAQQATSPDASAPAAPAKPDCKQVQDNCKDRNKKNDVSWFDWALGSSRGPSFHFIDFVELFVR